MNAYAHAPRSTNYLLPRRKMKNLYFPPEQNNETRKYTISVFRYHHILSTSPPQDIGPRLYASTHTPSSNSRNSKRIKKKKKTYLHPPQLHPSPRAQLQMQLSSLASSSSSSSGTARNSARLAHMFYSEYTIFKETNYV